MKAIKFTLSFLSLSFLFFSCDGNEKLNIPKCKCEIPILLDEFNRSHLFGTAPDSSKIKLSSEEYLEVSLLDCKGAMSFSAFDSLNNLLIVGSYSAAQDTSIIEIENINPLDGSSTFSMERRFEPKRNGTWIYYDKGKITKEVKY
jgi:hypothetical protein